MMRKMLAAAALLISASSAPAQGVRMICSTQDGLRAYLGNGGTPANAAGYGCYPVGGAARVVDLGPVGFDASRGRILQVQVFPSAGQPPFYGFALAAAAVPPVQAAQPPIKPKVAPAPIDAPPPAPNVAANPAPPIAETKKHFGAWEVSIEPDRFGDKSNVVAMMFKEGEMLAVRCLQSHLSIAFGVVALLQRGPYREGDTFDIKFRVDREPIAAVQAVVLNANAMQLATTSVMVREIMDGREVALRITGATATSDHVFQAGRAKEALAEVVKECPLDE